MQSRLVVVAGGVRASTSREQQAHHCNFPDSRTPPERQGSAQASHRSQSWRAATQSGSSEPRETPVQLAVIQWTRVAHKAIESFGDDPLWQIQLKHDGKPTVSI